MKPTATGLFAALAALLGVAGVIAGLAVIGSPNDVRMRRFDEVRVQDLTALSNGISLYRRTHESLPQKLDELASANGYVVYRLKDPARQPYEYDVEDAYSYRLCATFDRAVEGPQLGYGRPIFATHGKGKQCFSLQARPQAQR